MIEIELIDPLHLKFNTKDRLFLESLYDHFSEMVKGAEFTPKYQAGVWDGKISLFKRVNKTIPYGLLTDVLKFCKEYNFKVSLDPEITKLFRPDKESPLIEDSIWPLRDYQKSVVEVILKYQKGIFKIPTRGGKTYILYNIWNSAFKAKQIKKLVVIVPTTSLITQFYKDWIQYGIAENKIGQVYSKKKEWDKDVVIATWQTLSRHHNKLEKFDAVFVDEVHTTKAFELSNILKNLPGAQFRVGCTGTLPETRLEDLNVRSYLGPLLKEYSAHELKEAGYISNCRINVLNMNYNKRISGSYNDVKDSVFAIPDRLRLIADVLRYVNETTLILITKIEKEGEVLQNYINSCPDLLDFEVKFLSGRDKIDVREEWRIRCNDTDKKIALIATYPLFQQGITIHNLSHVIFGSSSKSKIRVLQSIGRSLGLHKDKELAQIWDISDNVSILEKHSPVRERHYNREKFEIKDFNFNQNDDFYKILSD